MRYREVIHAPLWLLAIVYFFMLSLVLSIWAALGNNAALLSLASLTIALVWIYKVTALTIEVDSQELRVGKAHITLDYVGQCIDLDSTATQLLRTRDTDPNAFLAIRFWAPKSVKLTLVDDRDQTPYWLISTRKGSELISSLKS